MLASSPVYTIVIPAYKEAGFIEATLKSLCSYLTENSLLPLTEVIVVAADGGDGTAYLAKKYTSQFKWLHVIEPGPKVGKGRDVRLGMLAAQGQYVLFMDADMATPLHHIKPIFELLEKGSDMAIGERNLKKIHSGTRLIGSMASNFLIRFVLLPGYKDTQCGFKALTKEATRQLFEPLKTTGWGFDFELLARAKARNYKVAKLPIPDWTDPKESLGGLVGESPLKALKSTLVELCKVKWQKMKGAYKA